MSFPPNPYAGGMPGRRTPDMPPKSYHSNKSGQRSPWGHSSPSQYSPYSSPRHHNQSPWQYSTHHSGGSPHFTPPHHPSYSPIPMQQPFSTPYSNNRGHRGRTSTGGRTTPFGDRRQQGQKTFHKDRRFSGGGGRGGHKRGSEAGIECYIKDDMLENPWAELERKVEVPPAAP